MDFSLVVCTYMRPKPLLKLLHSVKQQTLYPNEILIVDGSKDNLTEVALKDNPLQKLKYFKVEPEERGLTKQRNYGIKRVRESSRIICFLDDDTIIDPFYFEELLATYQLKPSALAVGGYITNSVSWKKAGNKLSKDAFYFDGWERKEPSRFKLRKMFNLHPDVQPGFMPTFSHGRSVGFLPPSGKVYQVEQIMGGVSSYKKEVFEKYQFSTYFEGYGLYEDADFSLRLAKSGPLFISTKAKVEHHHNLSGRPNKFSYGRMVVRNGWYVWRIKYPRPSVMARLKWNCTSFLLTIIRFTNTFSSTQRKEALTESLGRVSGWLSLFFNRPKIQR